MKRSELFFTFILIPIDILAIIFAFIIAYKLRTYLEIIPATYIEPFAQYFKFALKSLPVWFVVFVFSSLYSLRKRGFFEEFGTIFVAVSASVAIIMAWIFLTRTSFFSRLIIVYVWALAIILVVFARYIIKFLQRFLYRYSLGVHRVIVLGHNSSSRFVISEIQNNYRLGYKIVKIIDRDGIEKLETIVKRNPADEIIIADANLPQAQVTKVIDFCQINNLGFKITPNLFLVRTSHVDIQELAGVPILEFKRTPLDGWGKIIKRSIDIIGSIILIILTSPFSILAAILIKIENFKGPILYAQERVGLDKNFIFYKFRTMRTDAEKFHEKLMKKHGVMFKLKNDPRITTVGRFLRRTSIDEIPQFWNVLKGDMSLIGPRPPMPEEVEKYTDWQKRRLGVKPGITGLWQVSGRSELSFDEWVRLDAYYIENWSLWLDFQIFLKTILVVLRGRGAY